MKAASVVFNEKFWSLVKQLVKNHKSPLKSCKFYAANKDLVNKEFRNQHGNKDKKPIIN